MPAQGVYIQNLRDVQRWFAEFEPALQPVLRDELWKAADTTVKWAIVSRVPQRSGDAAASVRASSTARSVFINAGGSKAPYFPWLDFGGTLRPTGRRYNTITRARIQRGRYVYPGIDQATPALATSAEKAVRTTIQKARGT